MRGTGHWQRVLILHSPDNLLSGGRSEAKPQKVTDNACTLGDLLCVRAAALPHPDNKLSALPNCDAIVTWERARDGTEEDSMIVDQFGRLPSRLITMGIGMPCGGGGIIWPINTSPLIAASTDGSSSERPRLTRVMRPVLSAQM